MPQETADAAQYMTVTQPDGTVLDSTGVTLPSGKRVSHAEYEKQRKQSKSDEDDADRAADEAMREETSRSGKNKDDEKE